MNGENDLEKTTSTHTPYNRVYRILLSIATRFAHMKWTVASETKL